MPVGKYLSSFNNVIANEDHVGILGPFHKVALVFRTFAILMRNLWKLCKKLSNVMFLLSSSLYFNLVKSSNYLLFNYLTFCISF